MAFSPMMDLRGYMTPEQCTKVVNSAVNVRDKLILRLLWRTGARVSEILGLMAEDFIPGEKLLILSTLKVRRRTKQGAVHKKKRRVPIDDETIQMIIRFMKANKLFTGPLFKITRVAVFYIVRACGKRAGVDMVGTKHIHPHHFRHSFAVQFVKAGGDIRKLQMLLGHTSIATTAEYLQFSTEELRADYNRMWQK